jgi:hypothetical protein
MRRSLSRASASARLRSVKSSTKATPWFPPSSKVAAPISTGRRLPPFRKYSFSYGCTVPVDFRSARARASRSRHQRIGGFLHSVVNEPVEARLTLDQLKPDRFPQSCADLILRGPEHDCERRDVGDVAKTGELLQGVQS